MAKSLTAPLCSPSDNKSRVVNVKENQLNRRFIAIIASAFFCTQAVAQDIPDYARDLAACLTPEQKEVFKVRFMEAVMKAVTPVLLSRIMRHREAQTASDQARAAYIGCIKTAKSADKVPAEECADKKTAFDDREAVLKAQTSAKDRERIIVELQPELLRAAEKLRAELSSCEKSQ